MKLTFLSIPEPTPWTHETLDQFDRSVKDTLSLMRDLKCSWHDILPSRMYELAFSTLIQALCRAMVQRILACESTVDEHLVYMIAVILQDTAREILELFEVRFQDLIKENCVCHCHAWVSVGQ